MRERHIATLSTVGADGVVHAVPVGFTFEAYAGDGADIVRIITSGPSQKALNAARSGQATVSQVDGARWLSFSGPVRVLTDADSVRSAEARYTARYRPPRENPLRVVIEVTVTRILGSAGLRD